MNLRPSLSRHRVVIVGALGAVTIGAAGGTLLVHGAGSDAAPVAAATTTAPPAPGAATPAKHRHARHSKVMAERLVSVTGDQVTVADTTGATHVLTLSPRAKVVGRDGQREAASAIPAGDVVLVTLERHGGTPAATAVPSAPGAGAAPAADTVAVALVDTGFQTR